MQGVDNDKILYRKAVAIRRDFERRLIEPGLLEKIYTVYNPALTNPESFLATATQLFPALNCGLASVYLQTVLGKGEIIHGTYKSEGHTFLAIKNLIIDITADQFGGPKVYVGTLRWPWQKPGPMNRTITGGR